MIIVCRKCKYALSKMEFITYIASDAYDIGKAVAIDIIKFLCKKTIFENLEEGAAKSLTRFANKQQMTCPECFEYEGWITMKANEETAEKTE